MVLGQCCFFRPSSGWFSNFLQFECPSLGKTLSSHWMKNSRSSVETYTNMSSCPHICYIFLGDDLILFGEAYLAQACLMKQWLDDFCELSSQKVSIGKSMICVAPKNWPNLANSSVAISGSPLTANLGRYLVSPLFIME